MARRVRPRLTAIDDYSRNARLKPALLVVLPASVLITAWGLNVSMVLGVLAGPLTAAGFTFLLAQVGRDFGKKKEPYLFRLWSGKPSTVKLRHRDASINPHTRARYHRVAEKIIGRKFPTPAEEDADPRGADQLYEAVGDSLKERTRDQKRYPQIFNELVSYGFRRNLWGMKPIGLTITLVALVSQTLLLTDQAGTHEKLSALTSVLLAVDVVMLLLWVVVITPTWVKIPADAYAERLLAVCNTESAALSTARKTAAKA